MTGANPGDRRWTMTHEIFGPWAATDPAAAAAKAAQLTSASSASKPFRSLPRNGAARTAGRLGVAKGLPEGRDKSGALASVLSQWAGSDPKSAAAYALSLPSGQTRNNSISSIASQWANTDLPGAVAWVQQLPEGQAKQNALGSITWQWVQADPQAAMTYARVSPQARPAIIC